MMKEMNELSSIEFGNISALFLLGYFWAYILFIKETEAFWSRDTSNIRDISTENYNKSSCIIFCTKFFKNIFKYIFWEKCPKKMRQEKNIELCQNVFMFTKIVKLYHVPIWLDIHKRFQVRKCPNTLKLYTLKALLSKNWFCFFFFIF